MPFPFQQHSNRVRNAPSGQDNPIAPGDSDPQLQLQPGGASSNECDHKEVEQGEVYYGREEHQYYTYWFCLDCGEELEDE
tara:strand:- start:16 stop:255 length:240 start_codon:yes stop_codon:yes gene_type:complete